MFPLKPVALPEGASRQVTVTRAHLIDGGLEITVHNGNPDWTVASFKVMIGQSGGVPGTASEGQPTVGMKVEVFEFSGPIAPGGTMAGLVPADPRKAYTCWLVDVTGYAVAQAQVLA